MVSFLGVVVTADKIKKRKLAFSLVKIILAVLLFLLFIVFLVLNFVFNINRFTVSIDSSLERDKGIVIYDDMEERVSQRKLFADSINNMDNISINWIPEDIHSASLGGSHNGDNYIAYTFFIENRGEISINYWYEIVIDDVIKGVDEAVRVMFFLNDSKNVYAKMNSDSQMPEDGTLSFYSDDIVVLDARRDFKVGDIDKFTIVIFVEGDDPDCLNNIIGGEIMMHMEIREEHLGD